MINWWALNTKSLWSYWLLSSPSPRLHRTASCLTWVLLAKTSPEPVPQLDSMEFACLQICYIQYGFNEDRWRKKRGDDACNGNIYTGKEYKSVRQVCQQVLIVDISSMNQSTNCRADFFLFGLYEQFPLQAPSPLFFRHPCQVYIVCIWYVFITVQLWNRFQNSAQPAAARASPLMTRHPKMTMVHDASVAHPTLGQSVTSTLISC